MIDLTPLEKVTIKALWLDFDKKGDAAILRKVKGLERINDKPVAEFWMEVEAVN